MRIWAILTAAALLGGCVSLNPPPPEARPAPVPTPEAAPAEAALPAPPPEVAVPVVATRPPQDVRIDNTSIESFRATWQRLNADLSPAQKSTLNDAVTRLAFSRYPGMRDLPGNLRNSPIVPETIRGQLHGLSYAQIVALAPK